MSTTKTPSTPGASFFRDERGLNAARYGTLPMWAGTAKPWLSPVHLDVLRVLGYPVTVVDPKTGKVIR